MPIYAYRCASCGHTRDVLRKLSDPPLTTCPACSAETFEKQLTAAGFQLKGSGWYVTDFRDGPKKADAGNGSGKADAAPGKTETTAPAPAPASASAPAAAPAAPPAGNSSPAS